MRRKGLWRQPDFLKLWAGQAISEIGSRISRTAVPLTAVLALGASEFQMGILSGAGAATVLIFGLFAGAWADRHGSRAPAVLGMLLTAVGLAGMTTLQVEQHCKVDRAAEPSLSARAYNKILKLSRTIADLDGAEEIRTEHATEAIQYRSLDRNLWA
jgi:hypothetical protein